MFGKPGHINNYRQVGLEEFSDDDSDIEGQSNGRGFVVFVFNSIQRQQELMQQQDQGLEMLSQSAERLGQMSMPISEELGQQNTMLDEMDTDLDQAGENLDYVTRKTKEFIEKSGGTKNYIIIAGLSGVVILLFFLILYT